MIRNRIVHKISYKIGRLLSYPVLAKFDFETDKMEKTDMKYIVVSNHTTEEDMYMGLRAFPNHMYFVGGEHIFRTPIGKPLSFLMDPISAPRGASHIGMVREVLKRLKEGCNIMIFPEGCRSFNGETIPVSKEVGSLVKKGDCALVTYRTTGGYFASPRWGYKERKGKITGKIINIYSKEELEKMTSEEISEHINSDIYENAYESQKISPRRFKGKGLAEGLENYLIICNNCKSYDSIETKDNHFRCACCGESGTYDEYGYLKYDKDTQSPESVYDYGKLVDNKFTEDIKNDKVTEFIEKNVKLYSISAKEHTSKDLLTADVYIDKEKFCIGDYIFRYSDITHLSLLYFGKTALFSTKDGYYGLTGSKFRARKLDLLYNLYRKENN